MDETTWSIEIITPQDNLMLGFRPPNSESQARAAFEALKNAVTLYDTESTLRLVQRDENGNYIFEAETKLS